MSRIGKKPIEIPNGVKITIDNGKITVESGKNKICKDIPPRVEVNVENSTVIVKTLDNSKTAGAMQGLIRSIIAGMVEGVVKGFTKNLEIIGVGYKAKIEGKKLEMALGFSHPVIYNIPEGIKVTIADNTKLTVQGADKQLVGEVAATIRRFKKPEPYKGKGIRYVGEHIAMKEGKTVG